MGTAAVVSSHAQLWDRALPRAGLFIPPDDGELYLWIPAGCSYNTASHPEAGRHKHHPSLHDSSWPAWWRARRSRRPGTGIVPSQTEVRSPVPAFRLRLLRPKWDKPSCLYSSSYEPQTLVSLVSEPLPEDHHPSHPNTNAPTHTHTRTLDGLTCPISRGQTTYIYLVI